MAERKKRTPEQQRKAEQGARDREKLKQERKRRTRLSDAKTKAFQAKEEARVRAQATGNAAAAKTKVEAARLRDAAKEKLNKAKSAAERLVNRRAEARTASAQTSAPDKPTLRSAPGENPRAQARPAAEPETKTGTRKERLSSRGRQEKAIKGAVKGVGKATLGTARFAAPILTGPAAGIIGTGLLAAEAAPAVDPSFGFNARSAARGRGARDAFVQAGGVDPRAVTAEDQADAVQSQRTAAQLEALNEGTIAGLDTDNLDLDPILSAGGVRAATAATEGLLRRSFGFGDADEVTSTGIFAGEGEELGPVPTQEPPAPTIRQPQFDETGARLFTEADIGLGAANRGTASVEENQQVLGRLLDRNQSLRQAGFAAQEQERAGLQADPAATALAQGGTGLSSAFGALALSGNQLRREAADRSRAFTERRDTIKAERDLQSKIVELQAKSAIDQQGSFSKDARDIAKFVTDAEASENPAAVQRAKDVVVQEAIRNPNGAAMATASSDLAGELTSKAGTGFWNTVFNILGVGRGPADLAQALASGGFQNEFLNAVDDLIITPDGDLMIAAPDGRPMELQDTINIENLSPHNRALLFSLAHRMQEDGTLVRGQGQANVQTPFIPPQQFAAN